MKINDALVRYATQLVADGRSPHTIGQARRHVGMLVRWHGDRPIEAITHEDVARFLASDTARLRADGSARKATSANALRSSLRSFFSFGHAAGYTPTNAARLVRRAICAGPQPKALSDGDREKLMAALAQARTPAERRDAAMFTTMLGTGIRLGSAIGLDVEDVDLEAGELRLRRMKNGDEDVVYVPDDIVARLREFIVARTSGPLFPAEGGSRVGARQVHRRLETWALRAGIAGRVWPHRLRHTFAMAVFARTGDVLVTARALCHRSVASTAIYAQPSAATVRAAIAAI